MLQEEPKLELQPTREDMNPKLIELVNFLSEFQNKYGVVTANLRQGYGIYNRGCGPSCFVLGKTIQEKFPDLKLIACFGDRVPEEDGIFIVHGLQEDPSSLFGDEIDHAWILLKYQGQIMFISPESSSKTSESTFRATIVYSTGLEILYKEHGMKPSSETDLLMHIMNPAVMNTLKNIMSDINEGRIPEMYNLWYEMFVSNNSF